jgi:hypothetical protein
LLTPTRYTQNDQNIKMDSSGFVAAHNSKEILVTILAVISGTVTVFL